MRSVDTDVDEARRVWTSLGDVGIDVGDVAVKLEREGLASFVASHDDLLDALRRKADSWST